MTEAPDSPNRLRWLLPATKAERQTNDMDSTSHSELQKRSKRKRETVTAACETCRKRKSKCTGERPCSKCVSRGTECHYVTKHSETHSQALRRNTVETRQRIDLLEQLFAIMQEKPFAEAQTILSRIRNGADIESVLHIVQHGDLLLQLHLTSHSQLQYNSPYLSDIPLFLQREDNPYFTALAFEHSSRRRSGQTRPQQSGCVGTPSNGGIPPSASFNSVELDEAIITDIEVSKWTSIIRDESFLRHLLSTYFRFEYPTFTFFHKQYFLQDMKDGRDRFCSSFLVNAILAAACHGSQRIPNRNEFWNPDSLLYQFLAEAKRLWEMQMDRSSITTVQAIAICNVTVNADGLDKLGWTYLQKACSMAQGMGLFDMSTGTGDSAMDIVRGVTAWGLFSWQAQVCYHSFRSALIPNPPRISMPDPLGDSFWYGDIKLKFPMHKEPMSTSHPSNFYSLANFRAILNDLADELFSTTLKTTELSFTRTVYFYRRFRAWFDDLSDTLKPQNVMFPAQLLIHMHYHSVLINLFDRYVRTSPDHLTSFPPSADHNPEQIRTCARVCLETLLRMYYLRHGFDSYEPQLVYFLTLQSFVAFDELQNGIEELNSLQTLSATQDNQHRCPALSPGNSFTPGLDSCGAQFGHQRSLSRPEPNPHGTLITSELRNTGVGLGLELYPPRNSTSSARAPQRPSRSTLILAAKGLVDQGKNCCISQVIASIVRDRMVSEDVELLNKLTESTDSEADDVAQIERVCSDWPIGIVNIVENPDPKRLDNLIKNMKERNVRNMKDATGEIGG